MRTLQVLLFALAVLAFLVSAAFAGDLLGDIFWRAGVAMVLVDLAAMRLWPTVHDR